MKNVLFVVILLLKATSALAQADYPAALARFQRYYTAKQADSLFNMFSANIKAALPLDKTAALLESLHTQLGEIKSITLLTKESNYVVYKATFDNSILKL